MDPLLVDVCVAQKRLCLTSLILTVKRMSNPKFWPMLLWRFYYFDRSEYRGLCANPNIDELQLTKPAFFQPS